MFPRPAYLMILLSRVTTGRPMLRAVATINRSAGSPCKLPGRYAESIAMAGVSGACLMPGPARNFANHVFGFGRNCNAGRRGLGKLNSPTSHAEMGET